MNGPGIQDLGDEVGRGTGPEEGSLTSTNG